MFMICWKFNKQFVLDMSIILITLYVSVLIYLSKVPILFELSFWTQCNRKMYCTSPIVWRLINENDGRYWWDPFRQSKAVCLYSKFCYKILSHEGHLSTQSRVSLFGWIKPSCISVHNVSRLLTRNHFLSVARQCEWEPAADRARHSLSWRSLRSSSRWLEAVGLSQFQSVTNRQKFKISCCVP